MICQRWAWGSNFYGQLGTGQSGDDIKTPVQVGKDTDWLRANNGISDFTSQEKQRDN